MSLKSESEVDLLYSSVHTGHCYLNSLYVCHRCLSTVKRCVMKSAVNYGCPQWNDNNNINNLIIWLFGLTCYCTANIELVSSQLFHWRGKVKKFLWSHWLGSKDSLFLQSITCRFEHALRLERMCSMIKKINSIQAKSHCDSSNVVGWLE